MSLEIERKFLVKGEGWRGLVEPVRIRQGYVATKDGTTVRVRVAGDAAFITLKDVKSRTTTATRTTTLPCIRMRSGARARMLVRGDF